MWKQFTLGEDNNFEISRTSYNNAIEILNNEAEKYVNLDYWKDDDTECFDTDNNYLMD